MIPLPNLPVPTVRNDTVAESSLPPHHQGKRQDVSPRQRSETALPGVVAAGISGYEFSKHYSIFVATGFGIAALGAYVAFDRGAWRWPMMATLGISR
jgi:hypothetical protein